MASLFGRVAKHVPRSYNVTAASATLARGGPNGAPRRSAAGRTDAEPEEDMSMKGSKGRSASGGGEEDILGRAGRDLADAAKMAREKAASSDSDVVSGLKSLVRACSQISSISELRPLLVTIMDATLALSRTERGFVMLYEAGGSLSFVLGRTKDEDDLAEQEFRISMSTAAGVAESGEPVYAAGPDAPRAIRDKRSALDLGLKTIICAPLRAPSGIQGVLYADSRSAVRELSPDEIGMMNSFAEQAGAAIERTRQLSDLKRSKKELELECDRLRRAMGGGGDFGPMIGRSKGMLELFERIERVADTDATVLIEGETGTGKELAARTIHEFSSRKKAAFIPVNCGAIPEGLMESQLFGHKKGSFTGATGDQRGFFESADKGTLFLDEISEMPAHLQVKLLRALQDGEIARVGESVARKVDVRVISATNRDLEQEMEKGNFRSDLYYRLNVVPLMLPPLRDRGNDVLVLAQRFLKRFADRAGRGPARLANEVADALLSYSWPGNVRELENLMERVATLGPDADAVTLELLPPSVSGLSAGTGPVEGGSYKDRLESFERAMLADLLTKTGGNVAKAAAELEVSKQHVYNRMKRLGLSRDSSGRVRGGQRTETS